MIGSDIKEKYLDWFSKNELGSFTFRGEYIFHLYSNRLLGFTLSSNMNFSTRMITFNRPSLADGLKHVYSVPKNKLLSKSSIKIDYLIVDDVRPIDKDGIAKSAKLEFLIEKLFREGRSFAIHEPRSIFSDSHLSNITFSNYRYYVEDLNAYLMELNDSAVLGGVTTEEFKKINSFSESFYDYFGKYIDLVEFVRVSYFQFIGEYSYWRNQLEEKEVKQVFLLGSYLHRPMIKACKDLGVKVTEIQYALFAETHKLYKLFVSYSPYIPDEVVLWGSFFKDVKMFPSENKIKYSLHNPQSLVAEESDVNGILFLTTPGYNLINDIKGLAENVGELIYLKPHPAEFSRSAIIERYKKIEAENSNVIFVDPSVNIHDMLARCKYVIACGSSSAFESVGIYKRKTFIILKDDIPNIEDVKILVNNGYAHEYKDHESFINLKDVNLKDPEDKFFSKTDTFNLDNNGYSFDSKVAATSLPNLSKKEYFYTYKDGADLIVCNRRQNGFLSLGHERLYYKNNRVSIYDLEATFLKSGLNKCFLFCSHTGKKYLNISEQDDFVMEGCSILFSKKSLVILKPSLVFIENIKSNSTVFFRRYFFSLIGFFVRIVSCFESDKIVVILSKKGSREMYDLYRDRDKYIIYDEGKVKRRGMLFIDLCRSSSIRVYSKFGGKLPFKTMIGFIQRRKNHYRLGRCG